jgi:chemotaxis methyl-accepting protein methylase
MTEVNVDRVDDYIDYLQLHGEEFAELFNALLINVTSFFRDPETWGLIAGEIVPHLVDARPNDSPLRVWRFATGSVLSPRTPASVHRSAAETICERPCSIQVTPRKSCSTYAVRC